MATVPPLTSKATSFLEARDYVVQRAETRFLVAQKSGDFGQDVSVCVAIADAPPTTGYEDRLLDTFFDQDHRIGQKWLLSDYANYSPEFRQMLKELGVRVVTPALFFDTPFTYESDRRAAGAARRLATEGKDAEQSRVPQPFRLSGGAAPCVVAGNTPRDADLAEYLLGDIKERFRANKSTLWIVAAPAGQGKSRMFTALFSRLYEEFHAQKASRQLFPRPFPMVAEHLRKSAGPNLNGLTDSFLRTEVARHATPRLFDWMVENGHALWMLDGLDEVLVSDDAFVEKFWTFLTAPKTTALMLVSVRDSVLRSNEALRDLLEGGGDAVRVLELDKWGLEQVRHLAWVSRHDGRPSSGKMERDEDVEKLVATVRRSRTAKALASTPFYAQLMVQAWLKGEHFKETDELALLDSAVRDMCRREYRKPGPVDERRLPLVRFREWLEELASMVVEDGGVDVDEFREFASLALTLTEDSDDGGGFVDQMRTIPFLTRGESSGRLEFTHELIGDYLAGSYYARQAQRDVAEGGLRRKVPTRFGRQMGRVNLPNDSLQLRMMASRFASNGEGLAQLIRESPTCRSGRAFKNCVQLIAFMKNSGSLVESAGLSLDDRDLTGVKFGKMDLSNAKLERADVSFADLSEATLRGTNLNSVRLRGTLLPSDSTNALEGASLRQPHFDSVRIGGREITSYASFRRWAEKATKQEMGEDLPCASARQARRIFLKFVYANGEARTDRVDERAIGRGKREVRSHLSVVDAVIKAGYLVREEGKRVGRPRNELYSEIVEFVKDSAALSPGLRRLVDGVCDKQGCSHVA